MSILQQIPILYSIFQDQSGTKFYVQSNLHIKFRK